MPSTNWNGRAYVSPKRGRSTTERFRTAPSPVRTTQCSTPRGHYSCRWASRPGRTRSSPLLQLPVHRFFESTQRADRAVVVERQQLHHVDAADLFHRIDPELGVEDAGPAHAPRAAEAFGPGIVGRELKAETELVLAGAERERFRALLV